MIRFNCPACNQALEIEDQFARTESSCPACNGPIHIPEATLPVLSGAPPPIPQAPPAKAKNYVVFKIGVFLLGACVVTLIVPLVLLFALMHGASMIDHLGSMLIITVVGAIAFVIFLPLTIIFGVISIFADGRKKGFGLLTGALLCLVVSICSRYFIKVDPKDRFSTSHAHRQPAVETRLKKNQPQSPVATGQPSATSFIMEIAILVKNENEITVNGAAYDQDQLRGAMASVALTGQHAHVGICVDPNCSYQGLISVLDACYQARIEDINFQCPSANEETPVRKNALKFSGLIRYNTEATGPGIQPPTSRAGWDYDKQPGQLIVKLPTADQIQIDVDQYPLAQAGGELIKRRQSSSAETTILLVAPFNMKFKDLSGFLQAAESSGVTTIAFATSEMK